MISTWRQQQAQQNYLDGVGAAGLAGFPGESRIVDEVIEVATTVKITQDALDELIHSVPSTEVATGDEVRAAMHDGARAFLTALGFEVVQ